MTLTVSDGNDWTVYNFTVTVTNSPPTFLAAPPDNQSLPLNTLKVYQLVDFEGNNITVVTQDENGVPPYITFNGTSLSLRGNSFGIIGTHDVTVILTDELQNSTTYSFQVTFTNDPPYFTGDPPTDQIVPNNGFLTYALPEFDDGEGDIVILSLSPSYSWVELSESNLVISNPQLADVDTHALILTLNDGN
jgi:hypothetical protein